MIDRLLERALLLSVGLNILLGVWLWTVSRTTQDVEQRAHEYAQARTAYDSAKAERLPAIVKYRTLRDSLVITDTTEVVRVLDAADSVIASDERALAAADSALAKADSLISALRRVTKPRLIQPFAEILYQPYSRDVIGRLGVDVRVVKNVSLVAAAEARRDGPQALAGIRVRF